MSLIRQAPPVGRSDPRSRTNQLLIFRLIGRQAEYAVFDQLVEAVRAGEIPHDDTVGAMTKTTLGGICVDAISPYTPRAPAPSAPASTPPYKCSRS